MAVSFHAADRLTRVAAHRHLSLGQHEPQARSAQVVGGVDASRVVRWRDDHQFVPDERDGIAGNQVLLLGRLHLGVVGRREDIRLGAFTHLGHQRLGASEVVGDAEAGVRRLEIDLDLAERIGQ